MKKHKPKSKKSLSRSRFRIFLNFYIAFTALSLSAYFLFALLDPGLFSYDLRQKFRALADDTITVTATVLGPPAQPVATASAVCDASNGTLRVELDWADDSNTTSFDIERDSAPLVSGLSVSAYNDLNITVGTTYSYVVIANGPMGPGSEASDPVSVTTPAVCDQELSAPTASITSFAGKSLDSYNGTPETTNRRPLFTGTSNIANAVVEIVVGPESLIFATLAANANGYFEWRPSEKLPFATQTLTVTVTDPNDGSRTAETQLRFRIEEEEGDEEDEAEESTVPGRTDTGQSGAPGKELEEGGKADSPAGIRLTIGNKEKEVYQGQELYALLFIETLNEKYQKTTVPVRLSIIDQNGSDVVSVTRDEFLERGREVRSSLKIPAYLDAGPYLFRAEALFPDAIVSVTENIRVLELPILNLGGGMVITYNEVIRNLGWITLVLLFFLILAFFFSVREFGLYLQGRGKVTEQVLKRAGYFDK